MIADKLMIGTETVRDLIKKIYRKLEINSKTELIKKRWTTISKALLPIESIDLSINYEEKEFNHFVVVSQQNYYSHRISYGAIHVESFQDSIEEKELVK